MSGADDDPDKFPPNPTTLIHNDFAIPRERPPKTVTFSNPGDDPHVKAMFERQAAEQKPAVNWLADMPTASLFAAMLPLSAPYSADRQAVDELARRFDELAARIQALEIRNEQQDDHRREQSEYD